MTVDREVLVVKAQRERRRLLRVPVNLKGRLFLPENGHEADCTVLDMSSSSAEVACEIVPKPETPVVLYVDGFGRFDAVVAKPLKSEWTDGKFGVKLNCSSLKRERIAEQLTHYAEGGSLDETALRRHERLAAPGLARFTRATGEVVNCEVLDLSLGGVSLATTVRPQIGEIVLIGQMAGKIARLHENGVGIEFITPPPEKAGEQPQPVADALP